MLMGNLVRGLFGAAVLSGVFAIVGVASADEAVAATCLDNGVLCVDATTIHVGQTLNVSGDTGGEALNWIGSDAFVPRANDPYPGSPPGGSAEILTNQGGHYTGRALIRSNVGAGQYAVCARLGGANAGCLTIHVTR